MVVTVSRSHNQFICPEIWSKVSAFSGEKFLPVIVIKVPPLYPPVVGETLSMTSS